MKISKHPPTKNMHAEGTSQIKSRMTLKNEKDATNPTAEEPSTFTKPYKERPLEGKDE